MIFFERQKNNILIFCFFLLLSGLGSVVFGFTHTPTWQDASEYHAYAANVVSGNGYSLDGLHFSNLREPGYPLFLAFVYLFFGIGNITAVTIVQAILLAGIAFLMCVIFRDLTFLRGGLLLGSIIALFPSYGYYTHEVGSEILFCFLVTVTAFLLFRIAVSPRKGMSVMIDHLVLGIVVGSATFVRIQFLFVLPFLLVVVFLFGRRYVYWKGVVVAFVSFGLLIGVWSTICYHHIGSYALTSGRPELFLHVRAVRAELTFKELGEYYIAWIHKRVSADYIDPVLARADLVGLLHEFNAIAQSPGRLGVQKEKDMHTILTHPVHYLAGNIVEVAKLYYIEYLYTPYLGRIVRAGMYLALYLWTIFGLWSLYVHRKMITESMWMFLSIAGILVLYNTVFLSFFDTIPRYNTPFLVFFLALGTLGLFPLWRNRTALRE